MSSPVSSPVKAVLWDLDGTLIDSMEFHWLAWRETMAAEGRPVTYDQFLDTFGRTNASFLHEWLGPDASQAELDRVSHAKEAAYRGRSLTVEEGLQFENEQSRKVLVSEDAREGPLAFAQKRKPAYKAK